MEKTPNVLAIIPARGGSKGLPRKNVLDLGGKPLIAWSIEAALGARCVTRLVLSSDDDEIMRVAAQHGCEIPFVRPPELATDTARSVDVVAHVLGQLPGYEYVMLLQPTSPLRTSADIDAAFALMQEAGAPACVSISPVEESPYWMYQLDQDGCLKSLLEAPGGSRRQDLPVAYSLNGAIYIARTDWFIQAMSFVAGKTVGYKMPRSRGCDIDTAEDLDKVQNLLRHA